MGKKKFIDKKNSATFALLYRASGDGQELGDDRVYTRVDNNLFQVPEFEEEDESRFDDAEEERSSNSGSVRENLRRELLEMGFPDDGYNYMKHMRAVGAGGGALFVPTTSQEIGKLPVDVKAYDASRVHVEESFSEGDVTDKSFTGIKRIQAASVKIFDRDVTAALEEESDEVEEEEADEEGDLEDDFVLLANKQADEGECSNRGAPAVGSDHDEPEEEEEEEQDEEQVQPVKQKASDERSVRLLDEQFEVLALKEYDSDELEDEDDPRAKGSANLSQFESIFDEFLAQNPVLCGRQAAAGAPPKAEKPRETETKAQELPGDEQVSDGVEPEEVEAVWVDASDEDVRESWDVESIVSTFSNLDNHPSRIGPPGAMKRVRFSSVVTYSEHTIRLGGRQKLPVDFTKKPEKEPGKKTPAPAPSSRGQTREERKAHKDAVKEERRASRKTKKETKTEFRRAAQKAQAGAAGNISKSIHL